MAGRPPVSTDGQALHVQVTKGSRIQIGVKGPKGTTREPRLNLSPAEAQELCVVLQHVLTRNAAVWKRLNTEERLTVDGGTRIEQPITAPQDT